MCTVAAVVSCLSSRRKGGEFIGQGTDKAGECTVCYLYLQK
jgi:hypothetical protein